MTGGEIAGLLAAGVFAVLVLLLAVPILKLGKVFDELRLTIRSLNNETVPLIDEVTHDGATPHELERVAARLAARGWPLASDRREN